MGRNQYIIFLFFVSLALSQSQYVPLRHPVYTVLDYIVTSNSGLFDHYQKPYTRREVQMILSRADRGGLPSPQAVLVRRYLNEFSDLDRHLVRLERNQSAFFGDIQFGGIARGTSSLQPFYKVDIGGNIRGHIGPSLSYQTDLMTFVYLGNLDLKTGYGIDPSLAPIKAHDFQTTIAGDASESQVMLGTGWGWISFGSDKPRWGPAASGHLLLDIQDFSLPDVHVTANFGPFRYIKLYGTLDKLYPYRTAGGGKEFLAANRTYVAHRLDVLLFNRLNFGVSEAIVYNRNLELVYLNPLVPFVMSEVQAGDADNNLAAIDFSGQIFPHSRTYLELMVDDMDFRQDWFKDYVNKWTLLVGHQWADPLGIKNTLLTVETVRVEPYVYTHRDTANHYELYGQSLGYDLEPNSLRFMVRGDWFQRYNLWHHFFLTRTLHGDGDRIFGNPPSTRIQKQFLQPPYETRTVMTWTVRYEFFENMWFSLAATRESVDREKVDNTVDQYQSGYTRYSLVSSLSVNY
ncbi:MAG: hypothetical protein ACE5D8_04225 [Fidelibacterota bacterium]